MLSDRGIRDAIRREQIVIEPFNDRVGSCSYDLSVERIYELSRGVSFLDMPARESDMEGFLERYGTLSDGFLRDSFEYIGVSKEKVRSFKEAVITSRSSAARLFLDVKDAYPNRWLKSDTRSITPRQVYMKIDVFAPAVQVPEGAAIAQIAFEPSMYEFGEGFQNVVRGMRSEPPLKTCYTIHPNEPGGVVLHAGHIVKVHNGGILKWGQNNDHCFDEIDITKGYVLTRGIPFIMPTLEYLYMPTTHVGWLWTYDTDYTPFINSHQVYGRSDTDNTYGTADNDFIIHPNAPLIAPGSEGNQIFEIWHANNTNFGDRPAYYFGFSIAAGRPIALMSFHPLDQKPEKTYTGRYKGQRGAQTSLSHLG